MLLNFHFNYMARAMGGKDVVQVPQYLHIVLASEDQDRMPGFASRLDNFVLQESLLEEMNRGVQKMYDFKDQVKSSHGDVEPLIGSLSEADLKKPINHSTIFVPYFAATSGAESEVQKSMSQYLSQLEDNGKLKPIKKQSALKKYISGKIESFL